jgi:hypothetical protein
MATKLEQTANIATIAIGVVICLFLVQQYRAPQQQSPSLASPLKKGDRLADTFPVKFSDANTTVLIAAKTDCPACNQSLGFYRSLIAERNRQKANVQFVLLSLDSDTEIVRHMASEEIRPDVILPVSREKFVELRVVPTLIVTDSAGKIQQSITGFLEQSGQSSFMKQLFGGPSLR